MLWQSCEYSPELAVTGVCVLLFSQHCPVGLPCPALTQTLPRQLCSKRNSSEILSGCWCELTLETKQLFMQHHSSLDRKCSLQGVPGHGEPSHCSQLPIPPAFRAAGVHLHSKVLSCHRNVFFQGAPAPMAIPYFPAMLQQRSSGVSLLEILGHSCTFPELPSHSGWSLTPYLFVISHGPS